MSWLKMKNWSFNKLILYIYFSLSVCVFVSCGSKSGDDRQRTRDNLMRLDQVTDSMIDHIDDTVKTRKPDTSHTGINKTGTTSEYNEIDTPPHKTIVREMPMPAVDHKDKIKIDSIKAAKARLRDSRK